MNSLLRLHTQKLFLVGSMALLLTGLSAGLGAPKGMAAIDWVDVVGEGSTALALVVWLLMVLRSRPAGRVTNLLTLGLGFMFLAMWQDTLDEFYALAGTQAWESVVESVLMPIGLGLLTYGLWHWHKEQLSIRTQLLKREQVFRDHLWLDGLSQVARFEQIEATLASDWADEQAHQVALIVELHDFNQFERRYGYREADRLLRETGEYLILNLRQRDLICRVARDRLVILMPHTRPSEARDLAVNLRTAVEHFCFHLSGSDQRVEQVLDVGIGVRQPMDDPQALVKRATDALQSAAEGNGMSLVS
ncbi:diguanylate cyclase (GGDEF) domain-containing protein [Thalassolituus maritimus]|uniref:diguanylate cyclase n=1 Tax=Thalassolituus maritimus TaxID=484498 RepID=A0A1N7J2E3_9GAMM|nr:diguanylate cyclase [Thalassolituus maritimus]SIS43513.1 diguanylate cyclase (GGDEF) domain-containing protein [Thalassolituus maritimus]